MKRVRRILAVLLVACMAVAMAPSFSASETDIETDNVQSDQEGAELTLDSVGIKLTLPADYYYCYDENIDGYKDYFTQIGWDYDDTVETFENQGIELFAFDHTFVKEFYVIVNDEYDIFGGINLKNATEEEKDAAYNTYYNRYFGTYSMLDMYDSTTIDTDQAWYVACLFTDYTNSDNPVPVAEYWTVLNGKCYRFMLYGEDSSVDLEYCLEELEKIMETVEFTNVEEPDEVDARVKSEKRAEAFKIAGVIIGTVLAVAIVITIIVFISKRKDKRNEEIEQKK